MKTYKYTGSATSGATLEHEGKSLEVMLFPGRTVELPETHPWVARMVKRGFLLPVQEARNSAADTEVARAEDAKAEDAKAGDTRAEAARAGKKPAGTASAQPAASQATADKKEA